LACTQAAFAAQACLQLLIHLMLSQVEKETVNAPVFTPEPAGQPFFSVNDR